MLRELAEHGAPELATTACCIAECVGEYGYPLLSGRGTLFSRLADLIDPTEHERTVADNLALIERNRELECELARLKEELGRTREISHAIDACSK